MGMRGGVARAVVAARGRVVGVNVVFSLAAAAAASCTPGCPLGCPHPYITHGAAGLGLVLSYRAIEG